MARWVCLCLILLTSLVWLSSMPASAASSTVCASVGRYTESVVKRRDEGVAPSVLLKIAEDLFTERQTPRDDPMRAFTRWIVLYVYDMHALDATWLRQRVETKCLTDLPPTILTDTPEN